MSIGQKSKHSSIITPPEARRTGHGVYLPIKRGIDLVVATIGLILSSPLWLLICLATFLDDGRPIFFAQDRWGKGGKIFRLAKFRTMKRGINPVVDIPAEQDVRLTRVGRILRAVALDELPALTHILRGEMTFVGPKPLLPAVKDPTDPDYGKGIDEVSGCEARSLVRPGLTGLAQVYAPKDASYRNKFRYDALYIKRMNPWLDLKLFVLSLLRTFVGRWEKIGKDVPMDVQSERR